MANMEMRMIRSFETIDRDHRGFGTASALMTIIQSLTVWPGRKTIVYFSEGLPASPSLQAKLDSVVSAANRANVSVYAIDAAGLRSREHAARDAPRAGHGRPRSGCARAAPHASPARGPLTRVVERTEDLLRLDPQGGLARLAEDTGGFLVRDTNDLGSAFRRIEEDNRFHYMLTYSPKNEQFDGKFRTIGVKVRRDGAQVFSRKGYFAVRSAMAPVLSYEAPAIAALDSGKPPNAFAIGAAAMVFPEPSGKTLVPIVVQVRTNQLSFEVNQDKGTYTAQAAVVARLKDTRGETILTLSQQYILTGTEKELDAAKEGEILFYRQADLPPGRVRARGDRVRRARRARQRAAVDDQRADGFAQPPCGQQPRPGPPRRAGAPGRARAESAVLLRRSPPVPEHGRAVAARHGRGADVLHLVLSRRGRCRRRDGGDHEQRTHSRVDGPGDAPGGDAPTASSTSGRCP